VSGRVEPAAKEMVKVAGKGEALTCFHYREEDSSCMVYEHRFLECRLLKCWAPRDLLSIIGKNTILRSDVINPYDPVIQLIEMHEKECSLRELSTLLEEVSYGTEREKALGELSELARKDIAIRYRAGEDFGLRREYELFVFGRPVKDILADAGLSVITRKRHMAQQRQTRRKFRNR